MIFDDDLLDSDFDYDIWIQDVSGILRVDDIDENAIYDYWLSGMDASQAAAEIQYG